MGKPSISNIIFETTQDCNLDCSFCYNIWKAKREYNLEPTNYRQVFKTIKKLLKSANISNISFSGGEPFKLDRLFEIVLFCRIKQVNVTIISNGTLASNDSYTALQQIGVSAFQFSLHSHDKNIHDRLVGLQGAWEKTVASIRHLISIGAEVIGVVVLTRENLEGIAGTLDFYRQLGVTSIMLNRFNIGGKGIQMMNNLIVSKSELINAYTKANEFAANHDVFLTSNVCTPWCILNPNDFDNILFPDCANSSLQDKPYTVDFSGNFRICNHSPVAIGSIYKNKLADLLESEYVKSWEKNIPEECSSCEYVKNCMGGCRGAAEQLGGSNSNSDPIKSIIAQYTAVAETQSKQNPFDSAFLA